jgi:hypothetical protein
MDFFFIAVSQLKIAKYEEEDQLSTYAKERLDLTLKFTTHLAQYRYRFLRNKIHKK